VVRIFQARTKRTAGKRYLALLEDKEDYLQRAPPLQWVFAFLEQHWPYLVNAVESQIVPVTNNAVEMVTLVPALQVRVSGALTSTARNSVALSRSRRHSSTWACSRKSIALPLSQRMPDPTSVARARCN
jgi:hypothetical protein